MTTAKKEATRTMATLDDLLGETTTPVKADANGELVKEKEILSSGVFARYVATRREPGRARDWNKHVFALPDGSYFGVGGDAMLDSLLRKVKAGELVVLTYGGKVASGVEGNMAHQWRVNLVSAPPEKRDQLKAVCAPVYQAIRERVEFSKMQRGGARPPAGDAQYQHDDTDVPF